jgi:hypothetical protein
MKLLGIIGMSIDIIDQILIRFLDYSDTGEKFTDLKKAYDSVRREVLYSIPTEFGVPMKSD